MGRYSKFHRKSPVKKGLHPIWRGIGCILIIVVPLLAYGLMLVFVPPIIATGKIPYQLLGNVHFPEWAYHYRMLSGIAIFISSINNLLMDIVTFFVMLLLLTGVASLLYSIFYSVVGPVRYSQVDAPPSKYRAKKYTR